MNAITDTFGLTNNEAKELLKQKPKFLHCCCGAWTSDWFKTDCVRCQSYGLCRACLMQGFLPKELREDDLGKKMIIKCKKKKP